MRFCLFILVLSLFITSPVTATQTTNNIQYAESHSNTSCSCFWAVFSKVAVGILQTNSCSSWPLIIADNSDYHVALAVSGFFSYDELNPEDMCYDIFKPPKCKLV